MPSGGGSQLLRDRCWPPERWHCCDLWQRCLNHKLNSREFAAAYGVRIPQLYWSGHRIARLPIHSLPEHVVIKSSWGFGGRGTYLLSGTMDLVTGRNWNRVDLHRRLIQDLGPLQRFPYMAEEMQTTEEGVYAQGVEYNFYMFGDRIGAIMRVHRNRDKIIHYSVYTSDWTPITFPWLTSLKQGPAQPPPASLAEMCKVARCLGGAVGTFMRVDLYSTSKGVVFGEFSSTPRSDKMSLLTDEFLGRIWEDEIPEFI